MKALFVHDHRFIPVDGKVYSEAQFPASVWSRYLSAFDELCVLARRGAIPAGKQVQDLEPSSRSEVQFRFAPSLSGAMAHATKRREVVSIMQQCVAEFDAVIARIPSQLGLLAIEVARRMGKPWVVEVVGCPWDDFWNHGSWRAKAYAPIMTWRMRRAVAKSPFALYVTREFLQRRYPCSEGITVACSNVEIPEPSEAVLSARLGRYTLPRQHCVLGHIGSLHTASKGLQTILKALAELKKSVFRVELRILGPGDAQRWRELADQYGVLELVKFQGTLPAGEPVLRWLDDVDLYMQPSFQEGLPRALIEAMSRGCPAIGSWAGDIPELLPSEFLIKPGDAKGLARLIGRFIGNADLQRQDAVRNWKTARGYSREVLEPKRRDFWARIASVVRSEALEGRLIQQTN